MSILAQRAHDKDAMVADMEAVHMPSKMDFHSPRPTWLPLLLNVIPLPVAKG